MPQPVPCQCEHTACTHEYLVPPAGDAVSEYIGPICDACVPHMTEYIVKDDERADRIRQSVINMYAGRKP